MLHRLMLRKTAGPHRRGPYRVWANTATTSCTVPQPGQGTRVGLCYSATAVWSESIRCLACIPFLPTSCHIQSCAGPDFHSLLPLHCTEFLCMFQLHCTCTTASLITRLTPHHIHISSQKHYLSRICLNQRIEPCTCNAHHLQFFSLARRGSTLFESSMIKMTLRCGI